MRVRMHCRHLLWCEGWCEWIDHLNDAHHTSILVWKNVAMIDESSNEIHKWDTDYRFAIRRKCHCVLQAMCIISLTIHRHYLEIIDVNMKCMIFVITGWLTELEQPIS